MTYPFTGLLLAAIPYRNTYIYDNCPICVYVYTEDGGSSPKAYTQFRVMYCSVSEGGVCCKKFKLTTRHARVLVYISNRRSHKWYVVPTVNRMMEICFAVSVHAGVCGAFHNDFPIQYKIRVMFNWYLAKAARILANQIVSVILFPTHGIMHSKLCTKTISTNMKIDL